MLTLVGGGELDADAGLALRDHRVVETSHEYSFLGHLGGELLGKRSIVEHHGADGALGRLDVETGGQHLVTEVVHILLLTVVKLVAFLQHLEHLNAGGDDHRRQGVGEEVRTGALAEHVDDFLAACGESTHGATESLAKGTGEYVDTAIAIELFGDSVTGLTDNSSGMALVNHHESVIFLGQLADLVHRGDVAVHREHAVRADDAESLCLSLLEATLKVGHISVGVTVTDSLAETYSINDGCVVQGVGDDRVISREKRLEHTTVGIKAGCVEDGVLSVEEVRDGRLKFLVKILGSADETDR